MFHRKGIDGFLRSAAQHLRSALFGIQVVRLNKLSFHNLGDLYAESGQTLKGSLSTGWLAGKPDYPQKLKVPEGYEKINENRNI